MSITFCCLLSSRGLAISTDNTWITLQYKIINRAPYFRMKTVGSHSTSWREKKRKKEKMGRDLTSNRPLIENSIKFLYSCNRIWSWNEKNIENIMTILHKKNNHEKINKLEDSKSGRITEHTQWRLKRQERPTTQNNNLSWQLDI